MRTLIVIFSLTLVATAFAQTKVVVIPLGGNDVKPLQNVITVALANGDFDNPIDAVNSIPTQGPNAPSATNPYLVVIAPGLYELQRPLGVPSHVSLAGSGRKATILQFEFADLPMGFGTAVGLTSNTSISDMAIRSVVLSGPPSGSQSIAIAAEIGENLLERIDVLTTGYTTNIGISNFGSELQVRDSRVRVDGGFIAVGIVYSEGASGSLTNVDVVAKEAQRTNTGIMIVDSSPSIDSSSIVAHNDDSRAVGMDVIGEGSKPRITNSFLIGDTAGVHLNGNATGATITGSRISSVAEDPVGIQCRDNYDLILKAVSC